MDELVDIFRSDRLKLGRLRRQRKDADGDNFSEPQSSPASVGARSIRDDVSEEARSDRSNSLGNSFKEAAAVAGLLSGGGFAIQTFREMTQQPPVTTTSLTLPPSNVNARSWSITPSSATSVYVEKGAGKVVYSGWLRKQGNFWTGWKRRYFVLRVQSDDESPTQYGLLQFYNNNRFGKLKGEISLCEGTIAVRFLDIQKTGKPYCFEIVKGFYQASDERECKAWVSHLLQLVPSSTATMAGTPRVTKMDSTLGKTGTVVRESMYGVFNRRLTVEVKSILSDPRSKEHMSCQTYMKKFDHRSPSALTELAKAMGRLRDRMLSSHGEALCKYVDEPRKEEEQKMTIVSKAVTRGIEETLFIPLHDGIYLNLKRRVSEEQEAEILRKMQYLRSKNQQFYDIPSSQISPSNWKSVCRIMDTIGTHSLPSDKLDCLILAVREIHELYDLEKRQSVGTKGLDADDLLPIFTFVVVNSNLEKLLTLRELLVAFSDPWEASSDKEIGVDVSLLTSSIDYITSINIPGIMEDMLKDQVLVSVEGDWRSGLELEKDRLYGLGAVVKSTASGHSRWGDNVAHLKIGKGSVLMTVNGESVALFPYEECITILDNAIPPRRLGFLPPQLYYRMMAMKKYYWENALWQACKRSSFQGVKRLIQNKVNVNCRRQNLSTALHIAVHRVNLEIVKLLIEAGANVNAVGPMDRTPLHMLGVPLGEEEAISNEVDDNYRGEVTQIVEALKIAGGDLDARDIFGNTPAMLCARRGASQALSALLRCGANLEIRNWQFGYTALAWAAQEGANECIQVLLQAGSEVDCRSLDGETPLHIAASVGSAVCCDTLLQQGAHVNAQTVHGVSPLIMAASRGQVRRIGPKAPEVADDIQLERTIELLLHAGANPAIVGKNFGSALHYAMVHANEGVVRRLLTEAPQITGVKDIKGCTPLDLVTQKLLEYRASKHQQGSEGVIRGTLPSASPSSRSASSEPAPSPTSHLLRWASNYQLLAGSRNEDFSTFSTQLQVMWKDLHCTLTSAGALHILSGSLEASVAHLMSPQHFTGHDMSDIIYSITEICDVMLFLRYIKEAYQRAFPDFMMNWMASVTSNEEEANKIGVDTESKTYLEDYGDIAAEAFLRRHGIPCIVLTTKERVTAVRRIATFSLELLVVAHEELLRSQSQCCAAFLDLANDIILAAERDGDVSLSGLLASFKLPRFVASFLVQELPEEALPEGYEELGALGQQFFAPNEDIILETPSPMDRGREKPSESPLHKQYQEALQVDAIVEGGPSQLHELGRGSARRAWGGPEGLLGEEGRQKSNSVTSMSSDRSHGSSKRSERLLSVPPQRVAKQITLFAHYLYQKIPVSELLCKKGIRPAFSEMKQFFNHKQQLTIWVMSEILREREVQLRTRAIEYFITVAAKCRSPLHNFDGLVAIMNALQSTAINRLKMSWARLGQKERDLWNELKQQVAAGGRRLFHVIRDTSPPCVPYVGIYLQHLTGYREVPTLLEGGQKINFKKIRSVGEVLRSFTKHQRIPYIIPVDSAILCLVFRTPRFKTEEEAYDRSLLLEPRLPS